MAYAATVKELTEFFDITERTLRSYRKDTSFPAPISQDPMRFEAVRVHQWLVNREMSRVSGGTGADVPDYQAEKALLTRSQRMNDELKYQLAQGSVLPTEVVALVVKNMTILAKNKLLMVPSKVQIRCRSITREDVAIVDTLIRESLEELGDGDLPSGLRKLVREYQDSMDSATTPEVE